MNQNFETNEEMVDESLADDAVPVCPNCLEACHPLTFYCPKCGSNDVINPLASYMPYVRIRFNIGMIFNIRKKFKHATGWRFIFWFTAFYAIVLYFILPYLIHLAISFM